MEEDTTFSVPRAQTFGLPLFSLFLWLFLAGCAAEPATPLPPTIAGPTVQQKAPAWEAEAVPTEVEDELPLASYMGVEFTYDQAVVGPLRRAWRHPAVAIGTEPEQPEHIEFSFAASRDLDSPQMRIYPVSVYSALSERALRHIMALERLLDERESDPTAQLPLLPQLDALQSFHSEPSFVRFQNGEGISFMAQADHDHNLATAEVQFYTFQGLTEDGRFYVAAFLPLQAEDNATSSTDAGSTAGDGAGERQSKLGGESIHLVAYADQQSLDVFDEMIATLHVDPVETFPAPTPPLFASYPGMMIAYDPAHSGEPRFAKRPAVYRDPEGQVEFLPEIPDFVHLDFTAGNAGNPLARLTIQPVRNAADEYFAGLPVWVQQRVETLSAALSQAGELDALPDENTYFLGRQDFQSGSGLRHVGHIEAGQLGTDEAEVLAYRFEGLTSDGRYLVLFEHVLESPEMVSVVSLEALMAQGNLHEDEIWPPIADLDSMIRSLAVDANLSTESSVPASTPECTNDAEYLEDLTIPDNTQVERGQEFVKRWRVRNSGTCTWTPMYQVVSAGGNPIPWLESVPMDVVPPGEEAEIGVVLRSPEAPGLYQASWRLATEQGEPFGATYSILFEAPRPATDIPGHGVIEGNIGYPAGGIPALTIYFQSTDGLGRYALETEEGWNHYINKIPAGTYHVFARVTGDESGSGGGYTAAVVCGLSASCTDHTLLEVAVHEGKATKGIDIVDWYAPAGSFPLP